MSDNDLYHGAFTNRELLDRIQAIRTHYCTGPCGQSSSVLTARSNVDATLREAYAEIQRLREALSDIEQRLGAATLEWQTFDELYAEAVVIQIDAQAALKGGDDA